MGFRRGRMMIMMMRDGEEGVKRDVGCLEALEDSDARVREYALERIQGRVLALRIQG